jgi:hypothetical protein
MKVNDDIYKRILDDICENREELKGMISDLKVVRGDIIETLPGTDKKDFRDKERYNKFAMEERIKALSNFFTTELNIRKQLEISLEREFNIIRKLSGEEKDSREITAEDIEMLVEKMEEISGKVNPKDSFVTSDLDEL